MNAPPIPPVEKSIRLACDTNEAFRAFTEDFGSWWPFTSHSIGGEDKVVKVAMECRSGGRIYEEWRDGTVQVWGSVTKWRPPHSVAFSWHVGREPQQATEVELNFTLDDGETVVDLIHRNWENFGENVQQIRDGYASGWVEVFERRFGAYAREKLS